tara:strand:- start:1830 stop:2213 length:384 start_codon:yes stop_codon:yes gene_type:complete
MASDRHVAKSYLTEVERERLSVLSAQTGLSASELIRRLIMGVPLPSPEARAGWANIQHLLQLNADLARLGNLFKMALDDKEESDLDARLDRIAAEIETTKGIIRDVVLSIRGELQPTRKRLDDRQKS